MIQSRLIAEKAYTSSSPPSSSNIPASPSCKASSLPHLFEPFAFAPFVFVVFLFVPPLPLPPPVDFLFHLAPLVAFLRLLATFGSASQQGCSGRRRYPQAQSGQKIHDPCCSDWCRCPPQNSTQKEGGETEGL